MSYLGERINWQRCRRPLPSLNPQTTNSDKKHIQLQANSQDPKLILITTSRAIKKLRQTTTPKVRAFFSNQSRQHVKQPFQPKMTISKMIRDRHQIEDTTQKLKNCWGFISQRFQQENRKQQTLRKKQNKLKQTIRSNKSFKSFVEDAIKIHDQNVFRQKLSSKTSVINHRRNLKKTLSKSQMQRTIAGQIGRKQSEQIQYKIKNFKHTVQMKNQSAYQRGKSLQQSYHRHKIDRFNQRKRFAETNYRDKWMSQFIKRQKAQRQHKLKSRVLTRKIQNLLKQTTKIKQDNIRLSQSLTMQ